MFLFYTLMCRNYLELIRVQKKEILLQSNWTFLKSVWELFSKMARTDLKMTSNQKICGDFSANRSRPKIRPNPSPDGRDIPVLLKPKNPTTGIRKSI